MLWDLVAVVTKLSAAAGGASYNWMFVPVDPHTDAEYKYFLSLVDENGEMPRGGACEAEFDVHLKVQRRGQTLYSGLLRRYVPEEELETDAEIDAGEGGAGDRSRPGRDAHEERKAIVSRVLAFLSRDGRVPWLTSGSKEIRGKEPVPWSMDFTARTSSRAPRTSGRAWAAMSPSSS